MARHWAASPCSCPRTHTLERRLGSGYASLLLGASAIGAALSVGVMSSLHILSLIAGAIVGAAVVSALSRRRRPALVRRRWLRRRAVIAAVRDYF
ncbi:MAG: hypothetical protein R2748_23685 [Bryobacterales bacterium]